MTAPLASVLMTTFNKERWVGAAIESVLRQETDFPFELVIGDNHSSDGTLEVCRRYRAAHPDRVTLIERPENVGATRNYTDLLLRCRGRTISILDADDEWTDRARLQRHFDFLSENPECSMVFSKAEAVDESAGRPPFLISPPGAGPFNLNDLLPVNFIPNSATTYRAGLVTEFPAWLDELAMVDWPLHVLHAERGPVGFIDETDVRYRRTSAGISAGVDEIENVRNNLVFYRWMRRHLGRDYRKTINASCADACWAAGRVAKTRGRFGVMFILAVRSHGYRLLAALAR